MITFTTFHIENTTGQAKAVNSDLNKKLRNQYHTLIDLMFRSAKLFHPKCKRAVLSDEQSGFGYLDSSIQVFRNPLEPSAPMMFNRLASQINFVKQHGASTNLVTLDSDILVNGDVEDLFKEDFDIGLTYRLRDDMPINWGVMFISCRNPEKVVAFLEKILAVYRADYFDSEDFWCDQYALMDVIDRERFANRESDWLEIEDIKIKLLPCDTYNHSPENEAQEFTKPLTDRKIIHFKGNRKRFVEDYWNAYLAGQETPQRNSLFRRIRSRLQISYTAYLEERARRKQAREAKQVGSQG